MAIKRLVFLLCLLGSSCTQNILPEVSIQQVNKSLFYYLPSECDITIKQAQNWLTQNEFKRGGSYVLEKQLDWKSAQDFGFYLEVPFKSTYHGPKVNHMFNDEELAKINQLRAEWHFTISKCDNKYTFFISGLLPFKMFSKEDSKKSLLEYARQKNGSYSGLWLNFDGHGELAGGMELINGRGYNIYASSGKFPSTELEEIKQEIYNNSANREKF